MSAEQVDHRAFEKAWLKPLTDTIPEWDQMRYTQRMLARVGKQFVLWSLSDSLDPIFIELYTVTALAVGDHGPQMTLAADYSRRVHAGIAPQQLLGHSIYIWMPGIFDLRYTPYSYANGNPMVRQLTWRFCIKMMSNPSTLDRRKPGQVFFTELLDFRKLWPDTPADPA